MKQSESKYKGVTIYMYDDFEEFVNEYDRLNNFKNEMFFKKVADTIKDGSLIYDMLCELVRKRFKLDYSAPTHILVNKYFDDDIEMGFKEWLYCDNAPLLVELDDFKELFYELKPLCKSEYDIVDIVNNVYGLDFKLDYNYDCPSYVYSMSVDFNSFKPIDVKSIIDLKKEIEICKKHNIDTSEMVDKLNELCFGNKELASYL